MFELKKKLAIGKGTCMNQAVLVHLKMQILKWTFGSLILQYKLWVPEVEMLLNGSM